MKAMRISHVVILLIGECSAACIGATPSFSFPDTVPDVIIASQSAAHLRFGVHVAGLGDVNGDGYDDFVTSANRLNDCTGRAYLYFGGKDRRYQHADHVFDGEALGDFFGMWVFLADLNNDKYADVIVGAVGHNNWQGRVYVFFGGPDMDEQADMVFDGEPGTHGWFGRVIDAADIDRDGYTDLVLYAIGADKARGRAYLYYGGDPMDTVPDKIFEGENPGDVFGREMDMGPDVNGDGYGDIIFGSRSWNSPTFAGAGQGRAYLYYGGPPESMDTNCDEVFTGEKVGDQFGSSVCLNDVDADGHAEVMVGARGYNSNQGRMYLYWGGADMDARPDLLFDGETGSDFGGDRIECGHFNDDAYGDILVGAFNGGPNEEGRVYLYNGGPKASMDTVCDHTFTGERSMFGGWFNIGNINGDKYDDLIVSAGLRRPNTDDTVERLYVYYTKPFPAVSEGLQPQFVEEISEDVKPVNLLHKAAAEGDTAEVKSLVAEGANINSLASDSGMMTPLHEAAISGHTEVVEILLSHGARIDALDNMCYTPLHRAVEHGHTDVADLLIDKGADVNTKTLEGWTPLEIALRGNRLAIARLLIEKGARISSIHIAAFAGDLEKVRSFLDTGADVNAEDDTGMTPLLRAILSGHTDVVKFLIENGADVNDADERGFTPLIYAVWNDDPNVVRLLLDKKANVQAKDTQMGYAPLHWAVMMDNKETVELLLAAGADLNAKSKGGETLLDVAAYGVSTEIGTLLVAKGAEISSLHAAAYLGDTDKVKAFVDEGADINEKKGTLQNTPLHSAVAGGRKEVAEFLISKGADVNAQNRGGQTPLHMAAKGGHLEIVQLLTKNGANALAKNRRDQTPADLAQRAGHREIVELLRKKMELHDVVTTKVSAPASCIRGETVSIIATLDNQGVVKESCDATLIDASNSTQISRQSGTVLYSNRHLASEVDLFFYGEPGKDNYFGDYVAVGGDVNGDGFNDVLISSAGYPNSGPKGKGKAYLFYGGSSMDAVPDKVFTGENSGDYFGDGIHSMADLNNDDYVDLLIGAPEYNNGTGRLYIFYGGEDMDEVPDIIIDCPDEDDRYFGYKPSVGDVNGDGYPDMCVTALKYNGGIGRVYLYYGPIASDATADKVFTGEGTGKWFGHSVVLDGDIDNDGYDDLCVASRENGRVYLYWGADGTSMDEVCDLTFTGEIGLGCSLDVCDIDNDHYADVIIGSQGQKNTNGAWLYWGAPRGEFDNSPDMTFLGEQRSDNFGNYISVGAFNDDQNPDIIINAWYYRGASGRSYLYYGGSRTSMDNVPDHTFTGEFPNWGLGQIHLVDVNCDGYADVLGNSWAYNDKQGRAALWYGPFSTSTEVTFNWDTSNASIGKHTLKVEIPPVAGEQHTEDNVKTVTIEVKEPAG